MFKRCELSIIFRIIFALKNEMRKIILIFSFFSRLFFTSNCFFIEKLIFLKFFQKKYLEFILMFFEDYIKNKTVF